jgi:hypothetical protein
MKSPVLSGVSISGASLGLQSLAPKPLASIPSARAKIEEGMM